MRLTPSRHVDGSSSLTCGRVGESVLPNDEDADVDASACRSCLGGLASGDGSGDTTLGASSRALSGARLLPSGPPAIRIGRAVRGGCGPRPPPDANVGPLDPGGSGRRAPLCLAPKPGCAAGTAPATGRAAKCRGHAASPWASGAMI